MPVTLINKSFSATKTGPGRVHLSGFKKSRPVATAGTDAMFVQHTNTQRNRERVASKRERRAFRLQLKATGMVTYGSPRQRIRAALSSY